jgi:hypothetical protein
MHLKSKATLLLAGITIGVLTGCQPQTQAEEYLTVRICLSDPTEIGALKQEVLAVARLQGLKLYDGSSETEQGLDAISTAAQREAQGRPIINMTVRHGDEIVAVIGNLGLPSDQAIMAFYDVAGMLDEEEFARSVVARVEQKWRTEVLESARGVPTNSACTKD